MTLLALTRAVPESIGACELTHLSREPIDLVRARAQHAAYEECLRELGCIVQRLPAAHTLPDSVFVEDAAVVLPEVAVITRPGAPSRRDETESVAEALRAYRPLAFVQEPATLDGGDVLRVGRRVYVGQSGRTNADGCRQLESVLAPLGYDVRPVDVRGCLHLKTAVSEVGEDTVLVNPEWVDAGAFCSLDKIEVPAQEPFGANVLRIGDTVVSAAAHSRTRRILEARGIDVRAVDVDELARAEAGVTCCCLVFAVESAVVHPA